MFITNRYSLSKILKILLNEKSEMKKRKENCKNVNNSK